MVNIVFYLFYYIINTTPYPLIEISSIGAKHFAVFHPGIAPRYPKAKMKI